MADEEQNLSVPGGVEPPVSALLGTDCKACFRPLVVETVQIKRDGAWVDSSIQRCAHHECKNTFGGTLEDRLAYIRDTYGYKYFGDYELSPEQGDAIWEAKAVAGLVPELLAALRRLKKELTIPAAEYVPAIPACWDIIDAAIAQATGEGR